MYIDIRVFGDNWYNALQLPYSHLITYVAQFKCTHWFHKSSKKELSVRNELSKQTFWFNNYHFIASHIRSLIPLPWS